MRCGAIVRDDDSASHPQNTKKSGTPSGTPAPVGGREWPACDSRERRLVLEPCGEAARHSLWAYPRWHVLNVSITGPTHREGIASPLGIIENREGPRQTRMGARPRTFNDSPCKRPRPVRTPALSNARTSENASSTQLGERSGEVPYRRSLSRARGDVGGQPVGQVEASVEGHTRFGCHQALSSKVA